METVSQSVVRTDAKLEQAASATAEELCRHRWRWTLDESNPKRVSVRAYARAVARSQKTVQCQVTGYVAWKGDGGAAFTLNDHIERAKMGEERAAVVQAVAKANKVSFSQARKQYSSDVKNVQEAVLRKAEKDPDVDREGYAEKLAGQMARSKQATTERKAEKIEKGNQLFGVAYMAALASINGSLAHARRDLNDALAEARSIAEFEPDAIEYITASLDKLTAATNLVRLVIAGQLDVDWDAELVRIS